MARDSLRVEWDSGRQWLLIEDLAAEGLQWKWRPSEHAWVALRADRVLARKLSVHTGPPSGSRWCCRRRSPRRCSWTGPGARAGGSDQCTGTAARTGAGQAGARPEAGRAAPVDKLAGVGFGVAIDGALKIANTKPFKLDAKAAVRPAADGDTPRWPPVLQAGGSVEDLHLNGTLRGRSVAGREAPSVDLRASLRPLQAWPLAALKLQTEGLDLSALIANAPVTRISGAADVSGGETGKPLQAAMNLVNGCPGAGTKAACGQKADARSERPRTARRRTPRPHRIHPLRATAGRRRTQRGRLSGSAVWAGHQLQIDTRLDGVTPQRLDSAPQR